MIVDPNYQQELEKYENPVPSREFILQTIRQFEACVAACVRWKTMGS